MARYNLSKSESKRLGIPRVRLSGDGPNVRRANKFYKKHGYNPEQYSNDLRGQGIDVEALQRSGFNYGSNMNRGEKRRVLGFIAEARKTDPYAFYNSEIRRTGTAYDEAKKRYMGMLEAMKPRYQEFYNQLDNEERLAKQRELQLQGKEETDLRKTLAARGLDATNAGFQYSNERNKLQELQNTRAEGTALDFNRSRLDVRQNEATESNMINQLIAGTDIDKANAITNIVHADRNFYAGRNDAEEAKRQFNLNFALTQDENQARRAMEMYQIVQQQKLAEIKARRSGSGKAGKEQKEYRNKLAALVSSAKTGAFGTQPYIRENIAEQLKIKFPELSKQIDQDIYKNYMPNGWEKQILKSADEGVTESDINRGLAKMGKATYEQKAQFIRANGYNPSKFLDQ